ncbi:MAG: periplasmic heavy metal sensor [Balneola sp.]
MRQFTIVTLLLLLVGSVTVQAQKKDRPERRAEMKERVEQRKGKQDRRHRGPESGIKNLDLNEDQKVQMKEIMMEGRKDILPLENELGEKRARLRTLSSGDTYDVKALNQVVDEMSELQASIKKVRITQKDEIRNILNDEQKFIFDTIPDRKERLHKRIARKKR